MLSIQRGDCRTDGLDGISITGKEKTKGNKIQ